MKNIVSSMAVALTIWLGLIAGAANAAVLTLSDWTGSPTTGYTATFGNSGQSYAFTDAIPFSLPLGASGNFTANVNDTTVNALGMYFPAFYLVETSIGFGVGDERGTQHASLSVTSGPVPGSYTLFVNGSPFFFNPSYGDTNFNVPASYAGSIVISPVPEPSTYAMMLAGLGLIGFSARRKMNEG
ncbi:MAG: FxDxF family PEP-CTERM protein [Gallionella sp.]